MSIGVIRRDIIGVKRVMVFIDAGYVREKLKDLFHDDVLDYLDFQGNIISERRLEMPYFHFDIVRTYYYDALPQLSDPKDRVRQEYIGKIRKIPGFVDVLGNLQRARKSENRQKAVDTQIAVDMLSKAYEDHYDLGILITGDEDFLPVVEAVKNTGKQVFGVSFEGGVSHNLEESFDRHLIIDRNWILDAALKGKATVSEFSFPDKISNNDTVQIPVVITFSFPKGLVKLRIITQEGQELSCEYCSLTKYQSRPKQDIAHGFTLSYQIIVSTNLIVSKHKAFILIEEEGKLIAYREKDFEIKSL